MRRRRTTQDFERVEPRVSESDIRPSTAANRRSKRSVVKVSLDRQDPAAIPRFFPACFLLAPFLHCPPGGLPIARVIIILPDQSAKQTYHNSKYRTAERQFNGMSQSRMHREQLVGQACTALRASFFHI